MKINQSGINLIKEFESLQFEAYLDAAGVWTIGWGTTGDRVYPGLTIDEPIAQQWLQQDLQVFETAVSDLVKVPLNENQFAALVSFAYNVGSGALAKSTALKALNNKDYAKCCEVMLLYNKGDGQVLGGLARRRQAEVDLFNSPVTAKLTQPVAPQNPRYEIRLERDTYFTDTPNPGSTLPPECRAKVRAGTIFKVLAWRTAGDYIVVTFDGVVLKNRNTWYIHSADIKMRLPRHPTQVRPSNEVYNRVPYLSQLDNTLEPYGSCNVTSVAMCMAYFGHPVRNAQGQQLEDELNQYCEDHGLDRHSPEDLAKVVKSYGYQDDFQSNAKWADVKKWLSLGNPCIVHGYFTSSGHIIVIVGFNDKGWIINDPYGEWSSSGYDTSRSGSGLTYSTAMMTRLCGTDGDLWIHYLSCG